MASAITDVQAGAPAKPYSGPPPPTRGRGHRVPRLAWVALGLGALVGLYAWLGFRLAPRLLRSQATEFVRTQYGRELSLGEIYVHPFKLTLDVRDVGLPDGDGSPMLGLGRVFVDFEALESLFSWSYVLEELSLVKPRAHVVVRKDGSVNLADLAIPSTEPEPEEEDDALPRLRVSQLSVAGGEVEFTDRARRRPFHQAVTPISFTLHDFDTTGEDGRAKLSARLPGGTQISWRGTFGLHQALRSSGDLALSKVPAARVAEYLAGSLPCKVSKGWIALAGSYDLRLDEVIEGTAKLDYVKLTRLGLRHRGGEKDEVSVEQIALRGIEADLGKQRVRVDELEIERPRALAVLEPDGGVSLERLVTAPASTSRRDAKEDTRSDAPAWSATLERFAVTGGELDVRDQAIAPGTEIALRPISVEVRGASLDMSKELAVRASASIEEEEGTVRVEGSVRPEPLSADVKVAIEGARLSRLQPYVDRLASLTVRRGRLSSAGKVTFGAKNPKGERLVFEGGLEIDDLQTFDDVLRVPLLGAEQVRVEGIRHAIQPDSLRVKKVRLTRPFGSVVISPEGEINVSKAFVAKTQSVNLHATAGKNREPGDESKEGAKAVVRQIPKGVVEVSELEEQIVEATTTMPIEIGAIEIRGMALDFADHLVQPNFSAQIRRLSGSLRNLSTDPKSRARMRLDGTLGSNSPVKIRGVIRPFAVDEFSTVDMDFQNISLPIFNPYSATFAGYAIERGELSTSLHYEIRKRKIDATHSVRIDQLTWGDKTETKERASLPVRLATALLRDRHGVIQLDLPVTGSLDDPKFRIGPIVWQVIKNVIVKAVTAPFDLLGRLFKGADEAKYVRFAPGETELGEGEKKALSALAKALEDRPTLKVDLPAGTIDELDEPAVRRKKFERMLQRGAQEEAGEQASYDGLPSKDKLDVLETLYEELTGKSAELASAPAEADTLSRSERREATRAHQVEVLEEETEDAVRVDPSELTALGERRADTIERAILEATKVDPNRVLVSTEPKVSEDQGKVRFELAFQ